MLCRLLTPDCTDDRRDLRAHDGRGPPRRAGAGRLAATDRGRAMTASVTVLRLASGSAWRASGRRWWRRRCDRRSVSMCSTPSPATLCSSARRARSGVARALAGVALGCATRTPRSSASAARSSPSTRGSRFRASGGGPRIQMTLRELSGCQVAGCGRSAWTRVLCHSHLLRWPPHGGASPSTNSPNSAKRSNSCTTSTSPTRDRPCLTRTEPAWPRCASATIGCRREPPTACAVAELKAELAIAYGYRRVEH